MQGYWDARYHLFSKFDRVRVNKDTSYTLTPEFPAMQMANAIPGHSALEICSGAGGMTIAFARSGKNVTSVELAADCVSDARYNSEVYNVSDKVEFIHADAAEYIARPIVKNKRFDILFLDPPWGSRPGDYRKSVVIRMEDLAPGKTDLRDLADAVDCKLVAIKLPKNFDYSSIKCNPVIMQDYGFLRTAEESGFWRYSMLAMSKKDFVAITRFSSSSPPPTQDGKL